MSRVIKRYSNRKLYDVQARAYVSLEEVGALVRGGETVQVVDNATGDDITAQTLTLVILEEGKRGSSLLPTDLLHSLLRRGEQVLDNGLGTIRHGVEGVRHGVEGVVQGSLERVSNVLPALPIARRDELDRLRAQMAQMEATLGSLIAEREAAAPSPTPEPRSRPAAKKGSRKQQ